MVLHVLHETGQVGLPDLEGHIKDDIEREGTRISETTRKVRQAYQDIVSGFSSIMLFVSTGCSWTDANRSQTFAPPVQDDMMFADDGEMLLEWVTGSHQETELNW